MVRMKFSSALSAGAAGFELTALADHYEDILYPAVAVVVFCRKHENVSILISTANKLDFKDNVIVDVPFSAFSGLICW